MQGQRGFTLIEVSIALAIAGLVMATLMPNLGPAMARARLYAAGRDVTSGLRHARGQAIMRGEETFFELNTRQHYYRTPDSKKIHALPDDLRLGLYTSTRETLASDTGRIRFYPDGSSTGGRVTLIAGGLRRQVDVNWLTGEVKSANADPDEN